MAVELHGVHGLSVAHDAVEGKSPITPFRPPLCVVRVLTLLAGVEQTLPDGRHGCSG